MKKLILFVSIIACALMVHAQSMTIGVGSYAGAYKGIVKDTVTAADTVFNLPITIDGNHGESFYYDFRIKMTKYSGAGKVKVWLQAKKFSDDSFTDIATLKVAGTTTDTTFYWTQTTTKQFYNVYNIRVSMPTSTIKYYPSFIGVYLKK